MIYLSAEYIISAISQLSHTHPFLGTTYLVCKKKELPVGKPIQFSMDKFTLDFMNDVHKIHPTSDRFFQPYQTVKGKQWLASHYPSKGLQSTNTRSFRLAFIHERNSGIWAWATDYVSQIQRALGSKGKQKTPLAAMAVWIFKYQKWDNTITIEDIVENFLSEYHITSAEREAFFSDSLDFPNVPAFQNEPVTWNQLSNTLSAPPDAAPDQGGTLSKIELNNVGPCDHIEMEFSSRLNIVTGDNGLGKTFLLDCAWWALTNTWTGNEARPKYAGGRKRTSISFSIAGKSKVPQDSKVIYDNKNLTWERDKDATTIPGLIIYALVDGSYAVWDPSKGTTNSTNSMVFTKQQVWDGCGNSIEGLIRDWSKWQNSPDKYPFNILTQVLASMSPPDMGTLKPGETVRIPNDSREIPTIKYPYGIVPITNSSAGIGRIITLSYLMVWAWNEHKENCKLRGIKPDSRIVVMVDELEAHLHPKWQRTILPALLGVQKLLSSELEVQYIISTHSPLIMASAETVFDDRTDKLFKLILSTETADAILEEQDFVKYGQINSWLTSPVFNLNQARAAEAEQAINEAKDLQLADDPSDADVQAVHQKLLRCLAQNDVFWPRWIYFAEQHGVVI